MCMGTSQDIGKSKTDKQTPTTNEINKRQTCTIKRELKHSIKKINESHKTQNVQHVDENCLNLANRRKSDEARKSLQIQHQRKMCQNSTDLLNFYGGKNALGKHKINITEQSKPLGLLRI